MAVKARATVTVTRYRDTEAVTRYYRLQSSTLAKPAKPTAKPPSGWTTTEPAYAEGATSSLYTCELTTFSDGTWAYSDVSLSSSYEAAKRAYNEAEAAKQAAADALNKTHYGACNTAQATAAKATASDIPGFVLTAGASVRIKFTYANTAATPTLNVNGTGAKQIRLNGANSAYWVAGATVDFVFDGACWQVCNTPLYGAAATLGNPAGGNAYVDGSGMDVRQGSTVLARFGASLVELGRNAASAVVRLCGGKGSVDWSEGYLNVRGDAVRILGEHESDVWSYSEDGHAVCKSVVRTLADAQRLSTGVGIFSQMSTNATGGTGTFVTGSVDVGPGYVRIEAPEVTANGAPLGGSLVVAGNVTAGNDDATQVFSNGSANQVALTAAKLSRGHGFDVSGNAVVCREQGLVRVCGSVHADGVAGTLLVVVWLNGENVIDGKFGGSGTPLGAMFASYTAGKVVEVRAGDRLTLGVRDYGASAADGYVVLGGSRSTFLQAEYV